MDDNLYFKLKYKQWKQHSMVLECVRCRDLKQKAFYNVVRNRNSVTIRTIILEKFYVN
jgi:hypothetical protein